jgi:hypothetical protein
LKCNKQEQFHIHKNIIEKKYKRVKERLESVTVLQVRPMNTFAVTFSGIVSAMRVLSNVGMGRQKVSIPQSTSGPCTKNLFLPSRRKKLDVSETDTSRSQKIQESHRTLCKFPTTSGTKAIFIVSPNLRDLVVLPSFQPKLFPLKFFQRKHFLL